jgi:tungstate transport system ATP-binding protein
VLLLHRKLAVVFQESLLLNSSVWDNVTLGLRLRNIKGDEARARARKWLERFGIAPLARRQARTLSSGEAKRASLARAFALQPEVLFLDEPFTALDSPTRQALLEDFESVLSETRVTTVMVTHDRNEAIALADRVAVLMNGRIRQIGTPAEVFSSPVDEEVAGFVEAGNILHGVVATQSEGLASIQVEGHQIEASSELPAGTNVIVMLPYDDVTVMLPSAEKPCTSARNCLSGQVTKVFATGSQVRVTVDCGFPVVALITKRSSEELGLEKGKQVQVSFKAVSIRVIRR